MTGVSKHISNLFLPFVIVCITLAAGSVLFFESEDLHPIDFLASSLQDETTLWDIRGDTLVTYPSTDVPVTAGRPMLVAYLYSVPQFPL